MNIWKQRYDEMIRTCSFTATQRDAAYARVLRLEETLNDLYHHYDLTEAGLKLINETLKDKPYTQTTLENYTPRTFPETYPTNLVDHTNA